MYTRWVIKSDGLNETNSLATMGQKYRRGKNDVADASSKGSQEGGGKSRDGIFAYYITTASRSCIFSREDDSRFGITWNGKNIRSSWG